VPENQRLRHHDQQALIDRRAASLLASFPRDLSAAAGVWRRRPLLPVTSVLVYLLSYLPFAIANRASNSASGPSFVVTLPFLLFSVGYVGTERLWYKRAWEGRPFGLERVWLGSWRYVRRYLGLGFLMALIILVFALPSLVSNRGHVYADLSYIVPTTVGLLLLDFIATFMTPALAFTTRSPDQAIRLGLQLLRRTLPSSAPYVLVPPLALVLGSRFITTGTSVVLVTLWGVLATLLNLMAKGAAASYYLRIAPPPEPDAEPV
jgi:hypothetical protein